jgi:multidrug transporter EmrE-like cation transporter
MRIAVWIASGLLAAYCLMVGVSKIAAPMEVLQSMTNGIPVILLQIAGIAEIAGAIGLIVPAATRILPILTPIAAVGIVVTMLGATIANLVTGTPAIIWQTILACLLAAFVAWARFAGPAQITPRASSPEAPAT